jgi:hypothetical protein
MNEFRSVKQRDIAWSQLTLRRKARPQEGLGPVGSHADVHAICAMQQQLTEAGFAFISWENLRCTVIYLRSLPLPKILPSIGEKIKEAQ